jgi:hypothetical protein
MFLILTSPSFSYSPAAFFPSTIDIYCNKQAAKRIASCSFRSAVGSAVCSAVRSLSNSVVQLSYSFVQLYGRSAIRSFSCSFVRLGRSALRSFSFSFVQLLVYASHSPASSFSFHYITNPIIVSPRLREGVNRKYSTRGSSAHWDADQITLVEKRNYRKHMGYKDAPQSFAMA